jgi:hypothetical protein
MPAPSPAAGPALRNVLDAWREMVEDYQRAPNEALEPTGALSVAVHLLDNPPPAGAETRELFESVEASSLARRNIRSLLTVLLQSDPHITTTCRTTWELASALQMLALDAIARSAGLGRDVPTTEIVAASLMTRLFEADYRRGAFFHVYNIDLPDGPMALPIPGWGLVRMSSEEVALVSNEPTTSSRLYHPNTGNAFIRHVDGGTGDDWAWLRQRWNDASNVVRVLRYLKYGIVDLDWAALHYDPGWVNEVRKYGVSLVGRPRLDVQPTRFTMDEAERVRFGRYLSFYLRHLDEIDDMTSPLRKATSVAGDYYEFHHTRLRPEDRLIDLVISLEALFSEGREEISFRVSQRGAFLAGADAEQRRRIFKLLRRAYTARSGLVHGGDSPFATRKFTEQDLALVGEEVRIAILRLLTLHMRQHRNRNDVLAWIDDCALDPGRQDRLLKDSDFERYLMERAEAPPG